jgi:hypothetical protein
MTSTQTPPQQQQQTRQIGGGGLPPTGLQQQLNSLNQGYNQARTSRFGVNVRAGAAGANQPMPGSGMQGMGQPGQPQQRGSTSLNDLARKLAQNYGLAIGKDDIVDEMGNFQFTPDQLQKSSGGQETLGTAAAKMNYIAAAIQKQQTQQAMQKSEAALQSGLGLANQRRPGSMIEQQQQFYSGLAQLYQNQDYEAADFSYFIQKEKQDIEAEMMRKAERMAKKKAKASFFTGIGMTVLGVASGNYALAAQGASQAGAGGAEAGYF